MKEVIKDIIINFQTNNLKKSYQRQLDLPINTGIIVTVIGVRRSGKTFLLYQTIKKLLENNIPKNHIIYINFEDERLNLQQSDLDLILQAYMELFPQNNLEECYFFFDEIQNVVGWEKFARRVFENISTHIYITGSNSKLLSTEIATELRGRTISYTLYPLSFQEFLSFHDVNNSYYGTKQKNEILLLFDKFLHYGGFPEIYNLDNNLKIKKLQDYFNSIIYKDLIERYNISNPVILKYFIKKILEQVTKPISINKIYNDIKSIGYKVGNNVLYDFLDYIQATFTAITINKFDFSEIKQIKSEKKAYSIDNGILTALDYSFSENKGKLLENLIALETLKQNKEITYFKKNVECDFIIKEKNKYLPVQVSYTIKNADTKQREINGLLAACELLKTKNGIIVTYEEEANEMINDINVSIIPAYKFILDKIIL